MKFGINQAISQTITQLSCIQLETPSSRLWNFDGSRLTQPLTSLRLSYQGLLLDCSSPSATISNFPLFSWHITPLISPSQANSVEPISWGVLRRIITMSQWDSNLRNKLLWIFSEIHAFSFKKMYLKMFFCLSLNVLIYIYIYIMHPNFEKKANMGRVRFYHFCCDKLHILLWYSKHHVILLYSSFASKDLFIKPHTNQRQDERIIFPSSNL